MVVYARKAEVTRYFITHKYDGQSMVLPLRSIDDSEVPHAPFMGNTSTEIRFCPNCGEKMPWNFQELESLVGETSQPG